MTDVLTKLSGEGASTKSFRALGLGKGAAVVVKLAVTIGCFWYLSRRIDFAQVAKTMAAIDYRWASLAVLAIALEVPLVGIRWSVVCDRLNERSNPVPRGPMIRIAAIGVFLAQCFLYAAGDALRVWMLGRVGYGWRLALTSVVIDRGVGILTLFGYGFAILLLPSTLNLPGTERNLILSIFGTIVAAAVLTLILAPRIAPVLVRWPLTSFFGRLALAANEVLIKSRSGALIFVFALMVHSLSIASTWCTATALNLPLSPVDAAVLFVLMLGVALIPVSLGGWGVREFAVVSLLTSHGVAADRALLFSVTFGLVLVAGSLPGALVWAFCPPTARNRGRSESEHER